MRPLGIEVNGRPFFTRGASWVPSQVFLDTVSPAEQRKMVFNAKSVNMNMIRSWGGGYYEDNAFYDACDEAGIMVWMDFKFANSRFPTHDPAFMANVKAKLQDNIKRLRHHPSIAIWSGNNEVHGWLTEADYDSLFHVLLPNQLLALDLNGAYVPGSPESGDEHNWSVWHGGQPFANYLNAHMIDRYFNKPKNFNSTLWLSQINQAMGMSLGIDHWRTDWPNSTGALVWQYNDTWPGPSWSCVDYYGRWKAVMYRLRHAYAPLLVWGYANPHNQVQVKVASDITRPISAALHWSLTNLAGKQIESGNQPVHIPAGISSVVAWNHDFQPTLDKIGRQNVMLWLNLMVNDRSVSSQTVLFDKPKMLRFVDPHLTTHIQPAGHGYDVTISAVHPALYAWLDMNADASYSDNFVDLAGGKSTVIHVTPAQAMSAQQFSSALKVSSLYDTYDQSQVQAAAKPLEQSDNGNFVATATTAEIVGDRPCSKKATHPFPLTLVTGATTWTFFDGSSM